MKTFNTRLLSIAFLVVLGLGISAQVQAQTVVKCDIPFEFTVGGNTFQSGVYWFTVGDSGGSRIVLLRAQDGREARFIQAGVVDETRAAGTLARFRRYGTHYLLSSLSIGGDDISLQFTPTRAEREMMARAQQGEAVTVLAMR